MVSGDFNMVERPRDKSSNCGCLVMEEKKILWEQFKSSFLLKDKFSCANPIPFSWDNRRSDEAKVLGRLDPFYVSGTSDGNSISKYMA